MATPLCSSWSSRARSSCSGLPSGVSVLRWSVNLIVPLLALNRAERRERLAVEGSVPDDADALVDDGAADCHDVGEVGHGLLAGVDNQRPVLQVQCTKRGAECPRQRAAQ